MEALLTGSNGFIGSHLTEALLSHGYRVRCLVRKTSNLQWIQALPVEFVYGDVTDFDSLVAVVRNIDVVFHLGGTVRARDEAAFDLVNHTGTENLLKASREFNPGLKKFVFISSQAAAGPSPDGTPLKEDDPARPISMYGRSKRKAEEAVLSYRKDFPITLIRPPSVYGPRDDDILEIFKYVKRGIRPALGRKDKFISLIHVKDLIAGIVLAAEKEIANGRIYFLANPDPVSVSEFGGWIETAMGVKALTIRIPERIVEAMAVISEYFAKLRHRVALLNRDKAAEMKQRYWTVDSSRAQKELGFTAHIPVAEGVRETCAWYRSQGWL